VEELRTKKLPEHIMTVEFHFSTPWTDKRPSQCPYLNTQPTPLQRGGPSFVIVIVMVRRE